MTKILTIISLNLVVALALFVGLALPQMPAQAHPIDVSSVDLYVNHDNVNEPIDNNKMQIMVGISWQQAAALVEKATKHVAKQPQELTTFDTPYYNYFAERIKIKNNNQDCSIQYLDVPDRTEEEILFSTGILSIGSVTCPAKLDNMSIMVSLFTDDTPTQSNYVTVYDSPDTTVIGGLLTTSKTQISFDLDGSTSNTVTTPQQPGEASPFLQKLTGQLTQAQGKSLFWAMGVVFLIGLLHTLEAGHSKTVISSYMLQKKATMRTGFWYVVIFTLTHLADIIVLAVIFLVVNSYVDLYSKLSFLQAFAAYTLVAIAIYMVFKNTAEYLKQLLHNRKHHHKDHDHNHDHHDHEHDHGHSHELRSDVPLKEQLLMGFVTGLAPCLVGWGIFFIVLKSGQLWTFFPLILSFGLGIFVALMGVVWLIQTFKKPVFGKLQWIGEISPILSALLLLAFALAALL